jgi:hypothetical protein
MSYIVILMSFTAISPLIGYGLHHLFGLCLCPLQNITKLRLENSRQKFSPTKNSLQNMTYFRNVISNPATPYSYTFESNLQTRPTSNLHEYPLHCGKSCIHPPGKPWNLKVIPQTKFNCNVDAFQQISIFVLW